jgi:Telomere resolvase
MGRRAWLDNLLEDQYLPLLEKLQDSPEGREQATALCASLRIDWVRDGKTTLRQQQSLMAHTRNILKAKFGDNHFILDCIKFSTAEYIQLNNEMQGVVAQRNENIQYLNDPQALVDKANQLLDSPEWADIAAALSVLTGRRSSELLATAKFTAKSPYSVTFTGSLKRRGELQELSFEIPTLANSKQVCAALDKLRQQLPDAGGMTPESVNLKYGPAVARACDKHFTDLVPHRQGKDNLYTHLFRSVYATIATFWYCPPQVDPVEYRAAIQGHYVILDEMDMERRRSLAASRHYADYEISDSVISQNHGKRKGIKLGVSVEPIEPFKAPTQEKIPSLPQKKGQTSVRIFKEDKNLLEQVLEHLHLPEHLTQPKRMEHLLLWAKDLLEKPVETVKVVPVQTVQVISEPETAQLEPVSVQPEPVPTPVSGRRSREPINQLIGKIDQLVSILLLQQTPSIPQPSIKANVLSATPLRPSTGAALTGTTAGHGRSASAPVRPTPISQTPVKRVDDAAATSAHPSQDSAPQPTRPRLSKYETDDLLEHAVTAILNHNDQAQTHDQKWAITINALKGLGVKSQRKIQLFLDAHKEQIHDHHLNHQIDPQTHNLRHRRKHLISDVIVL